MTAAQLDRARRLLCSLQDHIRARLLEARAAQARHPRRQRASLSAVAAVTAADTIYQIDRVSEAAIMDWFEAHWPKSWPVELVMEGIADGEVVTFPRGAPIRQTQWKCILDPIDGTRGLMHDKRSAWSLAALAPQRGRRNTLRDLVVAAMTELPVSKQWRSDQYSAVRGGGLRASAVNGQNGERKALPVLLSRATGFSHGFASLAKFFPAGRALTAQLEERLWAELEPTASGHVFDDQYISTGGQLAEILAGHDRMVGDLRPLVFAKLGLERELTCHPYDICVELLLREAGGVVEDPRGGSLRAPLDTTSPVTWMAYANPILAKKVRPVLRRLLAEWV
jgi:fructose-1,6-bisphosphatase/inositol monophosphatase family enzyme